MAFIHSPKIITDGLVLALDAANVKSYRGSGTVWTDLSENNNTGTLTNGPTFSGGNGGSIVFDGTNDYVLFNSYNFGNEITVSCFINPTSAASIRTLFANTTSGATTNGIKIFINQFNTTNRAIAMEIGNGSSGQNIQANNLINFGAWQHVAFSLNKTSASGSIYYNGVLDTTVALTVTNFSTNAVFRMGSFTNNQFYYTGNISHYAVYNRALTANEVLQNFNATRSRFGV
jgi:hypothetical protein